LRRLLRHEAAPGVLLLLCAALAIGLANSPLHHAYHAALHNPCR
jgi:NhaA family Na+:H+ antiporter